MRLLKIMVKPRLILPSLYKQSQVAEDYFSYKYDSILKAGLTPCLRASVVVEVRRVSCDNISLINSQGEQQRSTDQKHEAPEQLLAYRLVIIHFLENQPKSHHHDEAQLEKIGLGATIRSLPVECKLQGHDDINVEKDDVCGIESGDSHRNYLIIDDTQSDFDIQSLVIADGGHHRAHEFQKYYEGLVRLDLLASGFGLLDEPFHDLRVLTRMNRQHPAIKERTVFLSNRLILVLRVNVLENLFRSQRFASIVVPLDPQPRSMVVLIIGDIDIVLSEVLFSLLPEFLPADLYEAPLIFVLAFDYLLPCEFVNPVS